MPVIADGSPDYESAESKALIEAMVEAHGGMEPWETVDAFTFQMITKVIGNGSAPTYSIETTDMNTGKAHLTYPFWDAQIAYDGKQVTSSNWPMPLPPGFFTSLTTSFITLPWLTQNSGVNLSAPRKALMPDDDTLYDVVRMTLDDPGPSIPGDFYDLFIDPESKLLTGIGFNITHPFMMRIANQPIGPNFHKFSEYQDLNGLVMPTYYETHGYNPKFGQTRAIHSAFGFEMDKAFNHSLLKLPDGAVVDQSTSDWWKR